MTGDHNTSLSFACFLTNSQTYTHATWYITGNQGLSAHEATESSTKAAWMATNDFKMVAIETTS